MQYLKTIEDLWKEGLKQGFRVIRKQKNGSVDYNWAREISNSRFDHQPSAVVFPKTAQQVSFCLTFCKENEIKFRVRSGGHQHEGMSSLDESVMIRLSEMNQITYPDANKLTAWIPTGKPLQEVYDELQLFNKTIPGGGCSSVNVGGLTLGGGWGTSTRKMGLTCDNFEEAEVVLANGDIVSARADNAHKDLFWALRGGGGGNFGIVTKFLFKLHSLGDYITTVNLQWKELGDNEEAAIKWYLDHQKDFPRALTTVMSLRVQHKDMQTFKDGKWISTYFPLGFIGKFYGRKDDLRVILKDFIEKFNPIETENSFKEECLEELDGSDGGPESSKPLMSAIINGFVDEYTGINKKQEAILNDLDPSNSSSYKKLPPPAVTCLAPHPHKISSGYPRNKESHASLAKKMVHIIRNTNAKNIEGVRLYMVLHSMPGAGGNIKSHESAFYYRDKEILLQLQSWWSPPKFAGNTQTVDSNYNSHKFKKEWLAYERDKKNYIQWIDQARQDLGQDLEGAFINFVDKNIALKEYYGNNFAELQRIKKHYDKDNLFRFPMSIPPAGSSK
ncbi:MAG: FAD-dependent oxidoreductase [Aureispira sp.]